MAAREVDPLAQNCDELGIDLERRNRRAAGEQRPRQRSRSSAGFEDGKRPALDAKFRDAIRRRTVHEEVLTETFLGPQSARREQRARMRRNGTGIYRNT